jgi:hypothetical protein
MKPSLDAFDIMAVRPGLRRFVWVSGNGDERKESVGMGTLGMAAALRARGHIVVCPILRERLRGPARHKRNVDPKTAPALPTVRDSALWPSYLIVQWKVDEYGELDADHIVHHWFTTRAIAWGQTAGIKWTLPSMVAARLAKMIVDTTNPPARFGAGERAIVAHGLHRGESIKILAARRNKDGSWTYQAEPPPHLQLWGKKPDYWISEDVLAPVIAEQDTDGDEDAIGA